MLRHVEWREVNCMYVCVNLSFLRWIKMHIMLSLLWCDCVWQLSVFSVCAHHDATCNTKPHTHTSSRHITDHVREKHSLSLSPLITFSICHFSLKAREQVFTNGLCTGVIKYIYYKMQLRYNKKVSSLTLQYICESLQRNTTCLQVRSAKFCSAITISSGLDKRSR